MIKNVYFFLRPFYSDRDAGYQHRSIALAEGLLSLGVSVYSNVDYWRLSPDSSETLFKAEKTVNPRDCDVLVTEHVYFDAERQLPPPYSESRRKYRTVFIDASDGWRTPSVAVYSHGVDLVLRCHFNSGFAYGRNVKPWAFGLSSRIVAALEAVSGSEERTKTLQCGYGVSHPVRKEAERRFIPLLASFFSIDRTVDSFAITSSADRLMWEQSGRRHYPTYYQRLKKSAASCAFGGYFVSSLSGSVDSVLLRAANKAVSTLGLRTRTVTQFDSWRYWESLAAGCATFHIDLERYGCRLPVMPENKRHYIGIDLDSPAREASLVIDGTFNLEEIGSSGKQWALDEYSPIPVARRFLQYVENS